MFQVIFFATEGGNEPVLDWLRALPREDRLTIGTDLRTVQFGFPIGMPLCRPLGERLFEVRSTLPSRREARLIFFQHGDDLVVVSGFIKKTQKTPDQEIRVARTRQRQFLSREVRR